MSEIVIKKKVEGQEKNEVKVEGQDQSDVKI